MSERSKVSTKALQCSLKSLKSKDELISYWLTMSPIELSWTAKNKCHHNMMPSYYDAEYLIFCHFLVMTHLVKLWNAFSLAFIPSPNYVPIVLIYELLHQRQYKQLFKWREDWWGLIFLPSPLYSTSSPSTYNIYF